MRSWFAIGLLLLFCFPSSAADVSFLWKLAESYRQSGDLGLEEVQLRKLIAEDPMHTQAQARLKAIRNLKTAGQARGVEGSMEDIRSILEGRTVEALEEKIHKSEKAEVKHMEDVLRDEAVTESQKIQIMEKLSAYYFKLAMTAINQEKIRVAIESLEKSTTYNDQLQLGFYELGFLYFRIRELQRGIENLERFVKLQPSGILSKTVRETLLNKYMSIARKYYYQQDFKNCKPYLERIIRLNRTSPESETALVYLMNLYFFQGMKFLRVEDYATASSNFYEALEVVREGPELDPALFGKLAQNAVEPFIKHAQQLFIIEKNYPVAFRYFQAVTWLVPGSAHSFLAKEYLKEIGRINQTAQNPVVYFSNFVKEENQRFLLEKRSLNLSSKGP
jgi:tetratricopeptide (TPR) repeat protein